MFDTSHIALIAATFVLAGLVKGVVGLGLPTVAVGLLSLAMTPAQAAALLLVPSFVTNIWQLFAGPGFVALLRRLWPMMLAICAGTWAGGAMVSIAGGGAEVALGVALIAYAALGLASVRLRVPARAEPYLSPLIGALTGLVTAATGVFVIPAVPYLQALGLEKDDLVQALGLSFTVSTIALAAVLAFDGTFGLPMMGVSLLALLPALAGMLAGQWIRGAVSLATFRLCFFVGLLALGAHLALRPVF
jgi:uncharacterized membrane protein YfcA